MDYRKAVYTAVCILPAIGVVIYGKQPVDIIGGIIFSLGLFYLAVVDFREGYLYDNIVIPLGIAGIIYIVFGALLSSAVNVPEITEAISGAIIGGGFFYALRCATRDGIGGGDVKLAVVLGIWLGVIKLAVALMASFILGGVAAAFLLISRKKSRRDTLAFGPFLAIGGYIAFIWGDMIWSWYSGWL